MHTLCKTAQLLVITYAEDARWWWEGKRGGGGYFVIFGVTVLMEA